MRGSKQELVVTIHKMVEIEDRSELCISKIVQVISEMKYFTTITTTAKLIKQQGRNPHWNGSINIYYLNV